MGRERTREEGKEGLGEDGCCWVGEGARLTCMNCRIREGIVQRAKTCCVPFPRCYITDSALYTSSYLAEGVRAEEESAAGGAFRSMKHTYCKLMTDMFDLQVKLRQFSAHKPEIRSRKCAYFSSFLHTFSHHLTLYCILNMLKQRLSCSLSTASCSPLPLQKHRSINSIC